MEGFWLSSVWWAGGPFIYVAAVRKKYVTQKKKKKLGKSKDKLQPVKTGYSLSSSRHLTVQWQLACRSLCPLHKQKLREL